MALDQAVVEGYLNTLVGLAGSPDLVARQSAIESYYSYVASEGVTYAPLALQVATNSGGFGQFANDILIEAGFSNKLSDLKLGLAIADADARFNSLDSSGNGILTAAQIADYHYSVYDDNNIPRAAWGGAFFDEFVGTGSWITLATSGIPSGDMAAALELLYDDIRSDQPNSNGVDIGDAAAYLGDAVPITDLGQAAFALNVAAGGALNVSMTSPTATLPAAFAAL